MNDLLVQLDTLEANLKALQARFPELPLHGVFLTRVIMHLGRALTALLEHQIRPFGLAEAEFRVLMTLFSRPDGVAHPGDLCAHASQSPANMSRISDALVSRDLITRVPSIRDRRKMVLRITTHGEDIVRRLLPTLLAPLRDMVADMSDAEQRQLIEQMKRLSAKLHDTPAHDPADRA